MMKDEYILHPLSLVPYAVGHKVKMTKDNTKYVTHVLYYLPHA